jgi:KDO2-lipid IV(A) lauroyltransferase
VVDDSNCDHWSELPAAEVRSESVLRSNRNAIASPQLAGYNSAPGFAVNGVTGMARVRSGIIDFAAYLVVRLGVCVLQMLTDDAAGRLAAGLAWLAYRCDRRHRDVAADNVRHAFPDLEARSRDQLVRGCFHHFAALVIEIARLPRKLHLANWRRYVDLVGGDKVVGAMTSGRSALIVTCHLGNWEMAGFALGLFGFRTHAIARTLDNPYLDRFLRRFREKTGQRVLAKKGDYDAITGLLESGGVLATLADQDAGPRGLFVDFFGRPASTHKAIALMALEFNVPLIVVGVPKVSRPMHYHVIVEDVIRPSDFSAQPDAARAITQRYTAALERVIRRFPEQYFWLHRRWKHQPAIRRSRRAA